MFSLKARIDLTVYHQLLFAMTVFDMVTAVAWICA